MDHAIRMKALGYAAKVAIGAAFVTGCGGSSETTSDNTSAPTEDKLVEGDSPACNDDVLAKLQDAFPDGDKQWYSHQEADPKLAGDENVTACCESIMKGSDRLKAIGKFRSSGCCAADFSSEADPSSRYSACTPWGPPVPPSMVASRKWVA